MDKRYKTDYIVKIMELASICDKNIQNAFKIISSGKISFDYKSDTGYTTLDEVRSGLEKDYFAPFEREDIFVLCAKLNELSEHTHFLCTYAADNNIFGFPGNIISLTECLKNTSTSIHAIFTELSKHQKKADLKDHIKKAEEKQKELKKYFYDCVKQSRNDTYSLIVHIIGECTDNCKEITQLIQYTLIKNS